jgi:hypothetical protein
MHPTSCTPLGALLLSAGAASHVSHPAHVTPLDIAWPQREVVPSVSAARFNVLLHALIVHGEFASSYNLEGERLAQVRAAAEATGLNERQALSMRKLLLTQRAITTAGRLRREPELCRAFCAAYEQGQPLAELSRELDIPPIALFRAVFRARNEGRWGESTLRRTMRRALASPERYLSERDCAELHSAMQLDAVSFTADDDMYGQRRGAYRLERALQTFLSERGVRYRTEDEQRLAAAGVGPLPSTPDVLLDHPGGVSVNGVQIHWIDAKAYFGPAPLSRHGKRYMHSWLGRTKTQAERYSLRFGRGALVFGLGHHEALSRHLEPDAIILDASVVGGSAILDTPADVVVVNRARRWSRDDLPPRPP